MSFTFKIIKTDKKSKARVGQIQTSHGIIDTPAFIPVGTRATVRGLTSEDLKELGVQILFGNTYHLHLRPGEDVVQEFGGLAKFMGWNGPARNASQSSSCVAGGPTITDSGGFQVFSLGQKKFNSSSAGGTFARLIMSQDTFAEDQPKSENQTRSLSERRSQTLLLDESSIKSSFGCLANDQVRKGIKGNDSMATVFADEDETEVKLVKIKDDGVTFRSHIDGSLHEFTPEKSIEIQQKLGADIILAFDECAPHPSTFEQTKEAMERTHKWAKRSLAFHKSEYQNPKSEIISNNQNSNNQNVSNFRQALYGIVQGGVYKDLREESAKFISSLGFDGIAIGGVSVGESKKEMRDAIDWAIPYLPDGKPRHLLGIGEIDDIFDGVERGMDTFDCVIPTRFGRYGIIFTDPNESEAKNRFRIDINRSIYAKSKEPLTKNCNCKVCKNLTKAYVRHLFRSKELLAYRLASYHNIYFVIELVKKIRESILEGKFDKLKKEWTE